jgi:hypothetical protein
VTDAKLRFYAPFHTSISGADMLDSYPQMVESADRGDIEALDREVMIPEKGIVRLLPAAFWHKLDRGVFLGWCFARARYGVVTEELIAWLRDKLAGRHAIEIAAGAGDLGWHLGIASTDSFVQAENPFFAQHYAVHGVATTQPGAHVRKLDALNAVHVYRPAVVVASWATHQSKVGPGNDWGVRETAILASADYLMIGNGVTHAAKPIMRHPHETHRFPGLVSRAVYPQEDAVWFWKRLRRR